MARSIWLATVVTVPPWFLDVMARLLMLATDVVLLRHDVVGPRSTA